MARIEEPQDSSPSDRADGAATPIEPRHSHVPISALTPRQREIAGLLARGLPNADIAQKLVLTTGTVANHVASILQRLQLDSRTQVAAWAVEHGLHGGQDRLLTALERLLDFEPAMVRVAIGHVDHRVAAALSEDRVIILWNDEASAAPVAPRTSSHAVNFRSELAVPLELGNIRGGVL